MHAGRVAVVALLGCFCLLLFDIDGILKRYAGGLAGSMDQPFAYRLTRGFGPDDVGKQLHCLAAFGFL